MDTQIVVRARAVIINEGKLLVVKHPNNMNYGVLPGGHLEWKEDIKECLSREIVEELGVAPQIGRLLYINNYIEKETIQSIEFIYEIVNSKEYLNLENLKRTHSHEIAEICWVKPSDSIVILPKDFGEDFKHGMVLSDKIRYLRD